MTEMQVTWGFTEQLLSFFCTALFSLAAALKLLLFFDQKALVRVGARARITRISRGQHSKASILVQETL